MRAAATLGSSARGSCFLKSAMGKLSANAQHVKQCLNMPVGLKKRHRSQKSKQLLEPIPTSAGTIHSESVALMSWGQALLHSFQPCCLVSPQKNSEASKLDLRKTFSDVVSSEELIILILVRTFRLTVMYVFYNHYKNYMTLVETRIFRGGQFGLQTKVDISTPKSIFQNFWPFIATSSQIGS